MLPPHFLLRWAYRCPYLADLTHEKDDQLLALPERCRLETFPQLAGQPPFAEVRVAWNELGLALQVEVRGKEQPPQGDVARPRSSDGATFWINTRPLGGSHRATRYCHQFHLLAAGAGPDRDQPALLQGRIPHALQDAPLAPPGAAPFRCHWRRTGYIAEVFLPASVLHGWEGEHHPRLGFFYVVRDSERGEQTLGLGPEFPYWEDPSLWALLELDRA
jgi:hypothetical protein